MAYEHKDGRGSLLRNTRQREGRQDPHYTGDGMVDGKLYWIDCWVERGEGNGPVKRLSLSFRPKEPKPAQQTYSRDKSSFSKELDDEIPF